MNPIRTAEQYRRFLKVLREARESAGVTQTELAARLGESQSFVSKCERGERRLDVIDLIRFCDALAIDPTVFLSSVILALRTVKK